MIQETSTQALEKIVPELGEKQSQVLKVITEFGPISNEDISNRLGWKINCVTGRVRELVKAGAVEDKGTRPSRTTGMSVKHWGLKTQRKVFEAKTYVFASKTRRGIKYQTTVLGETIYCNCPGFSFGKKCGHVEEVKQRDQKTLFG